MGNTVVSVFYRPLDQEEEVNEAFKTAESSFVSHGGFQPP